MHLTRLHLNLHSRDVQRALRDSHALHRAIMSMFPSGVGSSARSSLGILHRLDLREGGRAAELLVQSAVSPKPEHLPSRFLDDGERVESTELGPLLERVVPGAFFRFRLRANPTRKIETKSSPDGARSNGKRVPVRGDAERAAWLVRKLAAGGMRLADSSGGPWLLQLPDGLQYGTRRNGGRTTHDAHLFEGVLEIVSAEKARDTISSGIGPGKAFGFGLLSLAPLATAAGE